MSDQPNIKITIEVDGFPKYESNGTDLTETLNQILHNMGYLDLDAQESVAVISPDESKILDNAG